MNFFAITACAADAAPEAPGFLNPQLFMLIAMLVAFYFILILPQKKQEKRTRAMLDAVVVGDEVVTAGGLCGKVLSIKDDTVLIETGSDKTKLTFLKTAIRENKTVHEK